MFSKTRREIRLFFAKPDGWILAIFWIVGMVAGVQLARSNQSVIRELVPTLALNRTSVLFQLVTIAVPILFVWLAYRFKHPYIILFPVFLKTFIFGFSSCAVFSAYYSAGWLVCCFFLFSEICMLAPTFWLYLRQFGHCDSLCKYDLVGFAVVSVITVLFDFFAVSPFLTMVISSI